MITEDLNEIIKGCKTGHIKYQEMFYKHFYGYALTACLIYASTMDDALEIMNDGFLKVFKNIHKHDKQKSVKAWVRKIMINTAIDHYRKNLKYKQTYGIDKVEDQGVSPDIYQKLSAEEIIGLVQELSTSYRLVFNLFVIEGYSHKEIAKQLNIAESTSRANLAMANKKLRELLKIRFTIENA